MSLEPILRRCRTCHAMAHVKATMVEIPRHFYKCPDELVPFDSWEPVAHLDPRPCFGRSSWRACHSLLVEFLEALPEDIRQALPERLLPLRFDDLEDAVLDGLVVIGTKPVGDDHCLVTFGLRLGSDDFDIAWLGTASPHEVGTTAENLLREAALRMDLALRVILEEGA